MRCVGQDGALAFLVADAGALLIGGEGAAIRVFNQAVGLALPGPESAIDYARLYCSLLRGEASRYQVILNPGIAHTKTPRTQKKTHHLRRWADHRPGDLLDLHIALKIFVIFVSLCENGSFWDNREQTTNRSKASG